MGRLRPVVALDIDGVLRIRDGSGVDGAFSREITFDEDDYPNLFHGAPQFDGGTRTSLNWFSGVGAAWARDLVDRKIEVVLATTWQHWANTYFSDALGLPELPVAVTDPDGDTWFHCSPAWKSHQLSRQFNGRPLMWVDDSPWDRPGEDLYELRLPKDRAITRFQHTYWLAGIRAADVAEMDAWLALASTEEGHDLLRARRRRKVASQAAARRRWRRNFDARMGRIQ